MDILCNNQRRHFRVCKDRSLVSSCTPGTSPACNWCKWRAASQISPENISSHRACCMCQTSLQVEACKGCFSQPLFGPLPRYTMEEGVLPSSCCLLYMTVPGRAGKRDLQDRMFTLRALSAVSDMPRTASVITIANNMMGAAHKHAQHAV